MNYQKAKELADKICAQLYPLTDQLYIAGSVRRGCTQCKDIEIFCIPKRHNTTREERTLFDDLPVLVPGKVQAIQKFADTVNQWRKVKGDPLTGRYTRRELPGGYFLDLFMADESNIGLILAIRTGSVEFSKYLMWQASKAGYKIEEGYVYKYDQLIPVPDEATLFALLKIKYMSPSQRIEWPRSL